MDEPELVQISRSRRAFLTRSALGAVAAALGGGCGGELTWPSRTPTGTAGTFKLSDYPALATVGGVTRLTGTASPVAVVHVSQGAYAAFSMICPHQGSTIDIAGAGFTCPNHSARFGLDGSWQGGQPTNALVALALTFDAAAGTITIGGPIAGGPAPVIALAPTTESFAAAQGAGAPPPQSVAVSNSGGGTLTGLSTAIAYAAAQPTGWLTVSLNATAAPCTLRVAPKTGSLAPGLYTATVTLSSSVASVQPATLTVSFQVTAVAASPAIQLSATTATFAAALGGAAPSSQQIAVTNGGGGTLAGLSASVSAGASWLTAALGGAGAPTALTLNAAIAGLAAGSYSATVTVRSSASGVAPRAVSVTLALAAAGAPPSIVLSVPSETFNAVAGGPSPAPATVNVQNGGGGTLGGLTAVVSYAPGQPAGWLSAALSSPTAPSILTLTPTTGALTGGATYNATVTVSGTGVADQMLAVSVIVAGPPSIALSAQSATFAAAGGANPPQQQVQVTNGGGGSLSGLATSVAYGGGASGWLSATLTATTAPAAITLGVASSALATGTYTATVTVTASGAASKTIAVTLTVAPAGLAVPIASWPALANVGGIAGSVGQVQGTPTAVVRTGANGFAAYSMRCPHQGTTVRLENWQGTGSAFHCPNHDALFDSSGTLLPGSPQQTSNMLQRTVTYTPGDAVLYVS